MFPNYSTSASAQQSRMQNLEIARFYKKDPSVLFQGHKLLYHLAVLKTNK